MTIQEVNAPAFLRSGGKMGELIRSKDWSKTAVGTPDTWPQSLRTAVSILLNSQFPMFVWWGSELITIYNDAYIPIAGEKHPALLGKSGKEGWSEIWHDLSPLVENVFSGISTWSEDQALYMNRRGYIEETYFTFSYSPILDDSGAVSGLFCACIETTDKVMATRRIQESERNLRNTILQSPVAMSILKGPSFVVEIANTRMYELWGRGAAEMQHRPIFDALPEARHQGLEELLQHVYTTGKTFKANERAVLLPRQGQTETIYLNFVYEPFRDGDGNISGIIAVATDVTEPVITRKKVEASEQQVRTLVENAPFPIGVYVGREMRIALANQSIIDVWGKGPDVTGKLYSEVLPELENQNVYSQLDKVYTTGIPFHARNQRIDLKVDGVLKPFYFNYSFTPLYDAAGKIYGVMNTAADVTDLNLAKQQVEQSERNFRSIVLQAPVAMCILLGPDHVVDVANDTMIALWGKTPEAVMHKPVFEALPEVREQGYEQLLSHVYHTGETYRANERPLELIRNGKREILFQNFVNEPYRDAEGNILGVLAISIDVTEQVLARQKIEEVVVQRTKELAEANEALVRSNQELKRTNINLEEFAYAASHDMKEPIRKIHFFSDRLKGELEDKLNESQRRLFERLESASRRMGILIDDLLSYSQATRGVSETEEINLNKKIQNVLEDLELEVQQKSAIISVDPLPVIRGNRRQLQQLFQNLIGNALKYSKPGIAPKIHISAQKLKAKEAKPDLLGEEADKLFHLIEVRDNGIGFHQADAERIFNVFTRLHGNAEYKGTGVGLSIVRKVVENHHGMIWAKSSPGEGASFKILLPAEQHVQQL